MTGRRVLISHLSFSLKPFPLNPLQISLSDLQISPEKADISSGEVNSCFDLSKSDLGLKKQIKRFDFGEWGEKNGGIRRRRVERFV